MRSEHDANNALDSRPGLHLIVDNTTQWQTKRRDWFAPVSKAPAAFFNTLICVGAVLGAIAVIAGVLGMAGFFEVAR